MKKYEEFKHGEIVILDKEYRNSSEVKVISQSEPNRIFTKVQDLKTLAEWEVMTVRLIRKETI